MSGPEDSKKRDMEEVYAIEKANLEEAIAAWMQRALYAEKHNRVLQTKLDEFKDHKEERPAKKAKTDDSEEGSDEDEEEAEAEGSEKEDKEEDDEKASKKKLRISKKIRLAKAGDLANSFLDENWLAQKKSFVSKSKDTYKAYEMWCEHNNIPEMLTHCLFNKHMARVMPNGYIVTRGSGNKAVINFDYKLAAADVNKKAGK